MDLFVPVRNPAVRCAVWIFLPVGYSWLKIITCHCCLHSPAALSSPRGFLLLGRTGFGRREDAPLSSRRRAFVLPRACLCFPEDACQYLQDVLEYAYVVFCFCLLDSELCLPVRNWCFFWHAYFCVFGELCPCPC